MTSNTSINKNADAFGPVALVNFALNPTGAHMFRAQHEQILRSLDDASTLIDDGADSIQANGERVVQICWFLTLASSMMATHQSIEDTLVRRALEDEPRMRLIVEQFEREMPPLVSEMTLLSRRYPTPSSILKNTGEFGTALSSLVLKLRERFRAEERDIFPAYDRNICVPVPAGSLLAVD